MCKLPPEATFISNLGAFSPKKDKECKNEIFSGYVHVYTSTHWDRIYTHWTWFIRLA